MNNTALIIIAVVILVVVVLVANRIKGNQQEMRKVVSNWCREAGMPDAPFDITAAVRDVMSGKRPGIPRDGQWWIAMGIEQIGDSSRTRLLDEEAVPNRNAVDARMGNLFDMFGGTALMPPHLAEGRFVGQLPGVHEDVVFVRITGRQRPLGGWMVAVPPWLIGEGA
jgi:hypothetical protein